MDATQEDYSSAFRFVARRGCSYICLRHARPFAPDLRGYFKFLAANQKLYMRLFLLPSPEALAPRLPQFILLIAVLIAVVPIFTGNARAQSATPIAVISAHETPAAAPTPAAGRCSDTRASRAYGAHSADHRLPRARRRDEAAALHRHGRAPLWNGDDRCQFFYAENPRFARAGNNVQLETDGSLMIGVMVGWQVHQPDCMEWNHRG